MDQTVQKGFLSLCSFFSLVLQRNHLDSKPLMNAIIFFAYVQIFLLCTILFDLLHKFPCSLVYISVPVTHTCRNLFSLWPLINISFFFPLFTNVS